MSASKEGNAGDVKLYRESISCFIVRILETPDDDEMWRCKMKILSILDGYDWAKIGDEFEVSKSKLHGHMAGWNLFDLDDYYAKDWLKRCGVDLASVI